MRAYVCSYTHTQLNTYICVYMWVYTYTLTYAYIYICTHISMYVFVAGFKYYDSSSRETYSPFSKRKRISQKRIRISRKVFRHPQELFPNHSACAFVQTLIHTEGRQAECVLALSKSRFAPLRVPPSTLAPARVQCCFRQHAVRAARSCPWMR